MIQNPRRLSIRLCPLLAAVCFAAFSCNKEHTETTSEKYFPQVKTIIQNNCMSCHSATGQWAGRPTAFDTDTQIVAAAASIKAAVADPETMTNKRMPQGGKLPDGDISIIVNWLARGGRTSD